MVQHPHLYEVTNEVALAGISGVDLMLPGGHAASWRFYGLGWAHSSPQSSGDAQVPKLKSLTLKLSGGLNVMWLVTWTLSTVPSPRPMIWK
jgi:hypothetical protein